MLSQVIPVACDIFCILFWSFGESIFSFSGPKGLMACGDRKKKVATIITVHKSRNIKNQVVLTGGLGRGRKSTFFCISFWSFCTVILCNALTISLAEP